MGLEDQDNLMNDDGFFFISVYTRLDVVFIKLKEVES